MAYQIISDSGILIAKVSNPVANKIINSVKGYFRPYTTVKNPNEKLTAFHLESDIKFGMDEFAFYLWKDYVMVPVKE
jgi:hypothetical protein